MPTMVRRSFQTVLVVTQLVLAWLNSQNLAEKYRQDSVLNIHNITYNVGAKLV